MSEPADAAEKPNPHAEAMLKLAAAMLKATLIAVPPAAVIAVVLALVVAGQPGLIGSGIGVVLGFASSMTTLAMMRFSANLPPMFVMVIALGGYVLKLMVLFGVSFALRGIEGLSANAFAFSMLAVVVVAAAAEVRAFTRTKIPTIIPAS